MQSFHKSELIAGSFIEIKQANIPSFAKTQLQQTTAISFHIRAVVTNNTVKI
jgi:hypothetical protein